MKFKFDSGAYIKFNPYDGYFLLRLTDFESNIKLDKEKFIINIVKYINKDWNFIEMFHKRAGLIISSKVKRKNIQKARWKVFKRDNFTCQLCGSQELLELDHIIPISKGGEDKEENYQTLCKLCNVKKRDN